MSSCARNETVQFNVDVTGTRCANRKGTHVVHQKVTGSREGDLLLAVQAGALDGECPAGLRHAPGLQVLQERLHLGVGQAMSFFDLTEDLRRLSGLIRSLKSDVSLTRPDLPDDSTHGRGLD